MSRKPIKKIEALRDAIRGRRRTLQQIRAEMERRLKQIVNKQKLYTLLSVMIVDDEVESDGRGEKRVYWLA